MALEADGIQIPEEQPPGPDTYDAVDDVLAEAVRIHALGQDECELMPWADLGEDDKVEWLRRGRRLRGVLRDRGVTVTSIDDLH